MTTAIGPDLRARTLFGVPIHPLTMGETVERCREAVERGENLTIGVVNAAKLVKMRADPLLRDSVVGSDLVLADGMAVVWASRLLGGSLPERVAGIDLFSRLIECAEGDGRSVYLLGARRDVLLVVAGVLAHVLALERDRTADLLVQELAVVTDEQERAVDDLLAHSAPAEDNLVPLDYERLPVALRKLQGDGFLAAGSTAPAHRLALQFAALEYERLAAETAAGDGQRRLQDKARWLRDLAEK